MRSAAASASPGVATSGSRWTVTPSGSVAGGTTRPSVPSQRVVGLPGDTVVYRNKQLTVNGVPWPQQTAGTYSYLESLRFETMDQFGETVPAGSGAKQHTIAVDPALPAVSV